MIEEKNKFKKIKIKIISTKPTKGPNNEVATQVKAKVVTKSAQRKITELNFVKPGDAPNFVRKGKTINLVLNKPDLNKGTRDNMVGIWVPGWVLFESLAHTPVGGGTDVESPDSSTPIEDAMNPVSAPPTQIQEENNLTKAPEAEEDPGGLFPETVAEENAYKIFCDQMSDGGPREDCYAQFGLGEPLPRGDGPTDTGPTDTGPSVPEFW